MNRNGQQRPELSVLEPWWRAWIWACLPGVCTAIGFVVGCLAAYVGLLMYAAWNGNLSTGNPYFIALFLLILPIVVGSLRGKEVGVWLVKKLRGRAGQELLIHPAETSENERRQHLESDADDSFQKGAS